MKKKTCTIIPVNQHVAPLPPFSALLSRATPDMSMPRKLDDNIKKLHVSIVNIASLIRFVYFDVDSEDVARSSRPDDDDE